VLKGYPVVDARVRVLENARPAGKTSAVGFRMAAAMALKKTLSAPARCSSNDHVGSRSRPRPTFREVVGLLGSKLARIENMFDRGSLKIVQALVPLQAALRFFHGPALGHPGPGGPDHEVLPLRRPLLRPGGEPRTTDANHAGLQTKFLAAPMALAEETPTCASCAPKASPTPLPWAGLRRVSAASCGTAAAAPAELVGLDPGLPLARCKVPAVIATFISNPLNWIFFYCVQFQGGQTFRALSTCISIPGVCPFPRLPERGHGTGSSSWSSAAPSWACRAPWPPIS
jgi:hypothetical protein